MVVIESAQIHTILLLKFSLDILPDACINNGALARITSQELTSLKVKQTSKERTRVILIPHEFLTRG
jgi:hypothetical protein